MKPLSSQRRRFWKKVEAGAAWVFLVALFGTFGLTMYYQETRPTERTVETGRLIRSTNHGRAVYLTTSEDDLLTWLFGTAIGAALSAVGIHLAIGESDRRLTYGRRE